MRKISSQTLPLVSVIVPLYNQEHFLGECLKTICGQTYKHLEILIVNDGSTDSSPSIARRWAQKDNRIKIIDKSNEGVTWARRDGLLKASGEYIVFVDSDDTMTECAIESMLSVAIEHDVDLVFGGVVRKFWFIKQDQSDFFSFPYDRIVRQPELFNEYYVGFARNSVFPVAMYAKLYKKSVIDRAMADTELFTSEVSVIGEDQIFNFRLFPYLHSMYRINETVYFYRYGGMTSKYNPYFSHLLRYSDIRLETYDRFGYDKAYKPLFVEYVNMFYDCAYKMLLFKAADKEGVTSFFNDEIENRAVVTRLIEYFRKNPIHSIGGLDYIVNNNIDAMYNHVNNIVKQRRLLYTVKVILNKVLLFTSAFCDDCRKLFL